MKATCPQFFTATILNWRSLLASDKYKEIIIQSLKFMVVQNRIYLYAFVIMPSHIHLIWQMRDNIKGSDVQRDFLKFTAHQIKNDLQQNDLASLWAHDVDLCDRKYQFWQRFSLSVPLRTAYVFREKLDYIHNNPVKKGWKLANSPENYHYSSARFYVLNDDKFGFITDYRL